jgi:FlaA1/EpsC-like NDP-sugar epimerase
MDSGVDTVYFASGAIGIVVAAVGGVLAAVGGLLASFAARKFLITAREISASIENVERRLLVTQLRVIAEGVMSEAYHIRQISSTLKKMLIENAIVGGTSSSQEFNATIASIDNRVAAVATINREAQQRRESVVGLNSLGGEKLSKILTHTESNLVKLRRVRKRFEKNLDAYQNGEQFLGVDAA